MDKWFKLLCSHFVAIATILVVSCTTFPNSVYYYYSRTTFLLLYVITAYVTFGISQRWFLAERILPHNKAVLITGCDTGFGNLLAKRLDSRGFHVFASCLFPDGHGAQDLKQSCSDRLQVLYLDVTKDESVDKALGFVKQNLESSILWAVVNNAGILKSFTSELTTMEDFKETIEVNTLGTVRVTKAFLPLLKESKGRVVNITSNAGRFHPPELCAYSMSKSASVAFTESFSQDMSVWGIRAISIEPEIFRTPLGDEKNLASVMDKAVSKLEEDVLADYGEEYFEKLQKWMFLLLNTASSNTNIVIDDIELAITMKYPKHAYKPRRNIATRIGYSMMEYLPYEFVEKVTLPARRFLGYPVPRKIKYQASVPNGTHESKDP